MKSIEKKTQNTLKMTSKHSQYVEVEYEISKIKLKQTKNTTSQSARSGISDYVRLTYTKNKLKTPKTKFPDVEYMGQAHMNSWNMFNLQHAD